MKFAVLAPSKPCEILCITEPAARRINRARWSLADDLWALCCKWLWVSSRLSSHISNGRAYDFEQRDMPASNLNSPLVYLFSGNGRFRVGMIVDKRSSMSRCQKSRRILAPRKRVGDKLLKQLRLASWPFAVGASLAIASGGAGGRRGVQAT
jgi:hypothetical protein